MPLTHLLVICLLELLLLSAVAKASKYPASKLRSVRNLNPHLHRADLSIPERAKKAAQTNSTSRIPFHHNGANFRRTRRLIPGSFIVELAPDVKDARGHVLSHLAESGGLQKEDVLFRTELTSDIFNGVSFSVHEDVDISHITTIPKAVQAWPVSILRSWNEMNLTDMDGNQIRRVKRLHPIKKERSAIPDSDDELVSPSDISTLHLLTGVQNARDKLGLTGKGVKVAIIDSGVYHLHPALGGGFGPGKKVAFGYDLVGDYYVDESSRPEPDNDPLDDCSWESHGTHVAGIIGADARNITKKGFVPPTRFTGVAPGVTLGAYRVFGCGAESTSTDILMKALYMAHLDGADIINMSLGGGPSFGLDADSVAAARVANRGVLIVGAAGNDGYHGLLTSGGTGSHDDLISVASFDSVAARSFSLAVNGEEYPYTPSESTTVTFDDTKSHEFVINNPAALRNDSIIDDGCEGPSKDVKGKVIIYAFQSGKGCTSYVRFRKAFDAGASGCLQYYNGKVQEWDHQLIGFLKLPGGSVSRDVAEELWNQKTKHPESTLRLTRQEYDGDKMFYRATKSLSGRMVPMGRVSKFSSPGLRGDLAIKPDLGAPGADILSTVSPIAASEAGMPWAYNLMSGTSMASPYLAGTLALYLEAKGKSRNKTTTDEAILRKERANILTAFANTARPARLSFENNRYHSVALQGAGLVDVYSAITTLTTVVPRSFSLNDTQHTNIVHNITVTNNHGRTVVYTIESEGAATVFPFSSNGKTMPEEVTHTAKASNVRFSKDRGERSFSLKSGASRTIKLAFIPPSNVTLDKFPIYSGYVRVSSDASDIPITVPYAGMVGKWRDAKIFVLSDDTTRKADPLVTGVFDWAESSAKVGGHLALIKPGIALNATEGILMKTVLASPTRLARIEVVRTPEKDDAKKNQKSKGEHGEVEGLVVLDPDDASAVAEFHFVPRNTKTDGDSVFAENTYLFRGEVTKDGVVATRLAEGHYAIKFSALKHFSKSEEDEDSFEVTYSPPFKLQRRQLAHNAILRSRMSLASLLTLNGDEQLQAAQLTQENEKILMMAAAKASVRFAREHQERSKESRGSIDRARDPNVKLKSALNRRIRPLQVPEVRARISPNIPLTTRKFPDRPLIKSRLKASPNLLIVTGVNKSIVVAERLMRSKVDNWIEWFDCSSVMDLERSYREFASYISGGNPDDEQWARKAPFVELVQRVACTIAALQRDSNGSHGPHLTPLTTDDIGGSRRPSVATVGSGQASPISLVSETGWGEMEDFLFPPKSDEGKKRRGSVTSSRSVPNLRHAPSETKPVFVFHRATKDTFDLLLTILSAHKGSRFYILLSRGETLDTTLSSLLPPGLEYAVLDHPPLSQGDATNLLAAEASIPVTDALRLIDIAGVDFRELHIAAGLMKTDQQSGISNILERVQSKSSILSFALSYVREHSTLESPLWPVLALCSFMGSKPFPIQKLWTVGVELLQHSVLDAPLPEDGCIHAPDVHPAARMSTPRDPNIITAMTARINSCLKHLKAIGLVDLIGWRGTGKTTPITDARVIVPRSVRFAVLSKFQTEGVEYKVDTMPRGDIPLFRRCFLDSLRYLGKRLLFAACWVGPSHLVGLLLDMGFSASEPLDGISPLHMAAIGGDVDIASILLAADADVDAQDAERRTPIFLSVTYNNLDLIRLFLDHGANPSIAEAGTMATALHVAAASGFTAVVRVLLRGGAFRNPPLAVDGSTPLHLAIRNGHVATVVALRQCGASVHVRDASGLPALHLAASLGEDAVVKALLEWASPSNATDANGHNPLHIACFSGSVPVVRTLLEAGTSPHTRNLVSGDTPAHVAVRTGHYDVLKAMIDYCGPELLSQPTDHLFEPPASTPTSSTTEAGSQALTIGGLPPLLHATAQNRVDLMTLLLDNGAPINCVSSVLTGQLTALHVAVSLPDEQSGPLRLLLERGAALHNLDARRRSPVHHAAKKGKVGHMRLLLDAGASPDGAPSGSSSKTPLHIAAASGWPGVVKLLVERGGRLGVQGGLWKMSASSKQVDPSIIVEISEALKKRK
ncbi:hypothetical protein HDU67_009467 [Dinochytrium kinnereticum]|nr:hypothetical protein HDU67_009467 [Dinochytrium kinnereticum]